MAELHTLLDFGDLAETGFKFLLSEKREAVHRLVFDIWNDRYNCPKAPFPQDLTVVLVENRLRASLAGTPHRNAVNIRVAVHHNSNGDKQVPSYFEDHTQTPPPAYANVRDLSVLTATIAGRFVQEEGL